MRSNRATRVIRGVVAAAFATFIALLSHIAGGGAMPGWAGLVVPLVLSGLVSILTVGRTLSLARTGIAVGASQFFFHTLFTLGSAGASADLGAHAGHTGHGGYVPLDAIATAPMVTAADPQMWGWHGVAAIATALALHRGEVVFTALRRLAERMVWWLHRVIAAVVRAITPPRTARLAVAADRTHAVVSAFIIESVRRRGPPAFCTI